MTHEELLTKFTDYEAHFDQVRDEPKVFAMLRAVVELHKPFYDNCGHCGGIHGMGETYPCPTIQAIEKELNA